MAARQGLAKAQLGLGAMYYHGHGVPQDHAKTTHWYRMAADQGHAGAQALMGVMYVGGEGVVKDYVRAYIGFDLAASAGAAPAGKARDQFSKILTPNQIAEAERMARERSEKHRKGK